MKNILAILLIFTITSQAITLSPCEKCNNRALRLRVAASIGSTAGMGLLCKSVCSRLFPREIKFAACLGTCTAGGAIAF